MVFSALYDLLLRIHDPLRDHRRGLVADARGLVLDLGTGTGANLPHYPPQARVVAVEPNPHMLRRLRRARSRARARVHLVQARGEALPFPAGRFDLVVTTLVLCSVEDLDACLQEVRRVLRPGGRLLFCEHVRASSSSWARVQDVLTPLWKRVAGGCHPNRDTLRALERAGFRIASCERFELGPYPVRPHVCGVAFRP